MGNIKESKSTGGIVKNSIPNADFRLAFYFPKRAIANFNRNVKVLVQLCEESEVFNGFFEILRKKEVFVLTRLPQIEGSFVIDSLGAVVTARD